MKKAFTLIEILIVVSILGILSAIVFPEFQAHAQQSREAAAKDNLKILRNVIELYAAEHNGVPPGYSDNDPSNDPRGPVFFIQLAKDKNYLSDMPKNPFSDLPTVKAILDADAFPAAPVETELFGWVYKAATKTITLNWPGTDSEGVAYFDY